MSDFNQYYNQFNRSKMFLQEYGGTPERATPFQNKEEKSVISFAQELAQTLTKTYKEVMPLTKQPTQNREALINFLGMVRTADVLKTIYYQIVMVLEGVTKQEQDLAPINVKFKQAILSTEKFHRALATVFDRVENMRTQEEFSAQAIKLIDQLEEIKNATASKLSQQIRADVPNEVLSVMHSFVQDTSAVMDMLFDQMFDVILKIIESKKNSFATPTV
jgi:Tfp pilus assembly major pilin PilA